MAWDVDLERRLRAKYTLPVSAEATGKGSFVAEVAGKVMFAAPASVFNAAEELPRELAEEWASNATNNPYFKWVQGRFVEAENPNRNGHLWATKDLEFGEMGVKHGPLNWLHQSKKVIGAIADAALIKPPSPELVAVMQRAAAVNDPQRFVTAGIREEDLERAAARQRPFIAAVASMWDWIYPDEIAVVERASEDQQLFFSMECVSEQVRCTGVTGCERTFEFASAMRGEACEHLRERSSVRHLINPSFLGGAVVVPPARPGWGEANASVMAQATALAEQTADAMPESMNSTEYEMYAAAVIATARAL